MILRLIKNKWFFICLVGFSILLVYLPFYISGGVLGDFGDPIGQTIPNKFLLVEYIKNGILPLWNPFSFLGFPMLADIQVGAFYLPDIIIFSLFSPLSAHNISVLVHIIFASLGVYLLVKEISKSSLISFSLSLMMVLGGSFLSRIVYLNFLETIAFVPWILLIIQTKKISIPLLAAIIALMVFAGHPVALFYSLIVIFVFFLFNHFSKWKKVFVALLLGFLIASVQIIPFVFLKAESVRDRLSYSQFVEGSLKLKDLFMFINPFGQNANFSFDNFIYFGTFAFLCLSLSVFFVGKFSNKLRKMYFVGVALFGLGVILSLGDNFPFLSRILYELPVFNIIRVPARYIVLSHFGVLISLTVFFAYLINKSRKIAIILLALIIINSLFTPFLLLHRHEKHDAEEQYIPELKNVIEANDGSRLSITSIPSYFLSSSFFVFPNRHILNFMPNIIGYNPMILQSYYDFFPVAPVGSFENPNYFTDYYKKFELVGLRYYIFPTANFLKQQNLGEKTHIINFLTDNGWEKINTLNDELEIWKNPFAKPFAYFLNNENKINSIYFQPGEIVIKVNATSDDKLIVNQIFSPGWMMDSDIVNVSQTPKMFKNIVQSYEIKSGTKEVILKYRPKEVYYGIFLSLFGIFVSIIIALNKKVNYGKN